MAVCTFLEAFNFGGKTILPLCTHEGSGMGSSERGIKKLCPNAEVKSGLAIQGVVIFTLFITHHILNIGWYRSLFKDRYTPSKVFQIVIDILLLITMLILMYSSIFISRYAFAFLPITGGAVLARKLHLLGSFWGFVLMSLHLGIHWDMVLEV